MSVVVNPVQLCGSNIAKEGAGMRVGKIATQEKLYIPTGKVLGLSKIARIVDMYARRLQIQEQLTTQIAESVLQITGASGVGVIIEAKHMCMMMRGVEKQNSSMKTSAMLGGFRSSQATRMEFLSLVN